MLDDPDTLRARDPRGFLARLGALPSADPGPDGALPGPYGFAARGVGAVLAPLLAAWSEGPEAERGTHFLVDGGFDDGDLAALGERAQVAGASVVRIRIGADPEGDDDAPPGVAGAGVADVRFADDALAIYPLARYLAHATGRGDAAGRLERALQAVADAAGPARPIEENPAKRLAWALWQRVPLLVSGPADAAAQALVQQAFARVGKTLAVPTGPHPAGDWLPASTADPLLDAVVLWYAAAWVAAYGALLGEVDPSDERVYARVRAVA